ncbi:hypothetical protein QWZ08_01865 [Ferruginibacter paludis]|jgi:uncharacterized membrane protein|uniref:hypothetical protein n=1 Tax=Ferruginibacter TaxID=1004303 RepID=UPI0025B539FB|nr:MULTISPECIES: hypothetical protein [Ferruginibacter]MDB5279803.1 hypothetical protein [Ferruginibacter sp.]MDN3654352.1 hypothetical protein [Ferruginibacter paludis]
MKVPHVLARLAIYLLSLVMIIFGIQHFLHPRDLVNYVPQFLPGGLIWVYFVGIAFILVAAAFILNKWVKAAGYLLAVLLFIFVLTIHFPNFMNAGNAEAKQMALISLLKDTAIACFALYIGAGAHHQKLHMEDSD